MINNKLDLDLNFIKYVLPIYLKCDRFDLVSSQTRG